MQCSWAFAMNDSKIYTLANSVNEKVKYRPNAKRTKFNINNDGSNFYRREVKMSSEPQVLCH